MLIINLTYWVLGIFLLLVGGLVLKNGYISIKNALDDKQGLKMSDNKKNQDIGYWFSYGYGILILFMGVGVKIVGETLTMQGEALGQVGMMVAVLTIGVIAFGVVGYLLYQKLNDYLSKEELQIY